MRSKDSLERIGQCASPIGTAAFLDGAIVHDGRTGRLFRLNRAAALMWRGLRRGEPAAAIVDALARAQGAEAAVVRRDLAAFVAAAQGAGLLGPGAAQAAEGGMDARPPQTRPALDGTYRLGEVVVRVTCHPAEVAAAFAPLAAPARVSDLGPAEVRIALFRAGGAFVLNCDGRVVERLDTASAARWAMVRQLVARARRRPWLALLHAGALALPAGALLLCGDSGTGKSSLLAGLVHAGFRFMADDMVPLEAGSGLVWPVPLAISIKQGSWPALRALFPELAEAEVVRFGGRTMRYLWPGARAVPVDSAGCPAAAVLFPQYVEGAPAALSRLDPVEALTRLGEGGSVLPATDAGLTEFLAWWGRLPAYRLTYGQLDEAARAVRAWTTRLGPERSAPRTPSRIVS